MDNSCRDGRTDGPKARLKKSYMVMQDVNYELFADSVEAECSFGIRNPDQKLVTETHGEIGACLLPGTTPEHPCQAVKNSG